MTRIATFNVNGVNGRLPVLLKWLPKRIGSPRRWRASTPFRGLFEAQSVQPARVVKPVRLAWHRRDAIED
ncbi:hypothetical protein [Mesorhizobium sp. B2-8-9]|uniref:hypothetical protein n=1 Tax=Mesorhizobium sp. B2-8-9 TaxID=2589899 RepID=UPI00112A2903|nr:hypothetical protein [Mesorhizobium sp. B2-8-9]TPI67868.1 hypothetical protein FJ423_32145 [Mesorhizobium sp. B2-8-9]